MLLLLLLRLRLCVRGRQHAVPQQRPVRRLGACVTAVFALHRGRGVDEDAREGRDGTRLAQQCSVQRHGVRLRGLLRGRLKLWRRGDEGSSGSGGGSTGGDKIVAGNDPSRKLKLGLRSGGVIFGSKLKLVGARNPSGRGSSSTTRSSSSSSSSSRGIAIAAVAAAAAVPSDLQRPAAAGAAAALPSAAAAVAVAASSRGHTRTRTRTGSSVVSLQ